MALCLAAFDSTPCECACSPAPSFRTPSFPGILLLRFPFSCGHCIAHSRVSPLCYSSESPSPAVPIWFKMTSARQPPTLSLTRIAITREMSPRLSLLNGVCQSSARRRRPAFATSRAALVVALLFSMVLPCAAGTSDYHTLRGAEDGCIDLRVSVVP